MPTVVQEYADAEAIAELSDAIDAVDTHCRLMSWNAVVECIPAGMAWQDLPLSLLEPLLETVVIGHVMRSIDVGGLEQYVTAKRSLVTSLAIGLPKDKELLGQWVDMAASLCLIEAKNAAIKKIALYEDCLSRTDLSPGCVARLQDKIEKNKRYLQITAQDRGEK